jgi:16S rRNA (adenine1518-N6/adenine1519-N6)-dimethyltransferase
VHARIARTAALTEDDVVVEIGAGLGTLTTVLLHNQPPPRRLIAVERDPDMLAVLRAELGAQPNFDLRAEDAVQFDLRREAQAAGRPIVVVGNLPYQITTALLFSIIDAGDAVARAILMVQREFADRVVARAGSKIYGRLSVMVAQAMDARLAFPVSPGAFHPRPRVDSAVLSLVRRTTPLAPVRDAALFARVVKETFSTRRKMLRGSLAHAFGAEATGAALERSGIAGTRRPEELTVAEFARIADALADTLPPLPGLPAAAGP